MCVEVLTVGGGNERLREVDSAVGSYVDGDKILVLVQKLEHCVLRKVPECVVWVSK